MKPDFVIILWTIIQEENSKVKDNPVTKVDILEEEVRKINTLILKKSGF